MGRCIPAFKGALVRVLFADLVGRCESEDNGRSGGKRGYSVGSSGMESNSAGRGG